MNQPNPGLKRVLLTLHKSEAPDAPPDIYGLALPKGSPLILYSILLLSLIFPKATSGPSSRYVSNSLAWRF